MISTGPILDALGTELQLLGSLAKHLANDNSGFEQVVQAIQSNSAALQGVLQSLDNTGIKKVVSPEEPEAQHDEVVEAPDGSTEEVAQAMERLEEDGEIRQALVEDAIDDATATADVVDVGTPYLREVPSAAQVAAALFGPRESWVNPTIAMADHPKDVADDNNEGVQTSQTNSAAVNEQSRSSPISPAAKEHAASPPSALLSSSPAVKEHATSPPSGLFPSSPAVKEQTASPPFGLFPSSPAAKEHAASPPSRLFSGSPASPGMVGTQGTDLASTAQRRLRLLAGSTEDEELPTVSEAVDTPSAADEETGVDVAGGLVATRSSAQRAAWSRAPAPQEAVKMPPMHDGIEGTYDRCSESGKWINVNARAS